MNTTVSGVGERYGIGWLTYSPLQMHAYHLLAKQAAPAVAGAVEEVFPGAVSLLDVGAGSGATAAELSRRGKHVQACEWSLVGRLYARAQGVRSVKLDLREQPSASLEADYDLAYCLEVAEHLPAVLGQRLVSFLCQIAPIVVFSAAPPGQGGVGHINEQPARYWIDRFQDRGYAFDAQLSSRFRESAMGQGASEPWLLHNPMVVRRSDYHDDNAAASAVSR